jgi:hypothetical protein
VVGLIIVVLVILVAGAIVEIAAANQTPVNTVSTSTSTSIVDLVPSVPDVSLTSGSSDDVVLVREVSGAGTRSLPAFTPTAPNVYFQFVCVGKGSFTVIGYFKYASFAASKREFG